MLLIRMTQTAHLDSETLDIFDVKFVQWSRQYLYGWLFCNQFFPTYLSLFCAVPLVSWFSASARFLRKGKIEDRPFQAWDWTDLFPVYSLLDRRFLSLHALIRTAFCRSLWVYRFYVEFRWRIPSPMDAKPGCFPGERVWHKSVMCLL